MFVLGTAGHVDHGKSTLIKALTGIDPDRLIEEKERSMTIDLGFAWLKLPSGREVGIVDVPGHEHFIRNMLAGVSGFDLALLVVDANEGVMPQTREHLAILDLMEIPKAVAVITKADTVDKEVISLVTMEIDELLAPTHLAGSPVVAVSSVTGEGLKDLVAVIDQVLNTAAPKKDIGRPRLPIDRVFTIAGSGTVVTGTLIGGSLQTGAEVEIMPGGIRSRLRSLQTHKSRIETASPGSRVAANLVGVSASQIARGHVLTAPGWLSPSSLLDVKLRLLREPDRPLRHGTKVSFYTGSTEVPALVRILDNEALKPGDTGVVQLALDAPVAAVNGDHFIIRSPMDTLGGGTIIEVQTRRYRRFRQDTLDHLKAQGEGTAEGILLTKLAGRQPQELSALIQQSNQGDAEVKSIVNSLVRQKKIILITEGPDSLLSSASGWAQLINLLTAAVQDYHRNYPLRLGISKAELQSRLKMGKNYLPILRKLIKDQLLIEEKAVIRLPGHTVQVTPDQQAQMNTYLSQLNRNPSAPAPEIALEPDLFNLLVEKGQAVKTSSGVVFSAPAYEAMRIKITDHIEQKGRITLAEARDLLGTSRKYAQSLLEHLDEKKITRRVGDDRVLFM